METVSYTARGGLADLDSENLAETLRSATSRPILRGTMNPSDRLHALRSLMKLNRQIPLHFDQVGNLEASMSRLFPRHTIPQLTPADGGLRPAAAATAPPSVGHRFRPSCRRHSALGRGLRVFSPFRSSSPGVRPFGTPRDRPSHRYPIVYRYLNLTFFRHSEEA